MGNNAVVVAANTQMADTITDQAIMSLASLLLSNSGESEGRGSAHLSSRRAAALIGFAQQIRTPLHHAAQNHPPYRAREHQAAPHRAQGKGRFARIVLHMD